MPVLSKVAGLGNIITQTYFEEPPQIAEPFSADPVIVKNDLANTVFRGLPVAAITLCVIYAGLTIAHIAVLEPALGMFLVPTAAVSAIFFLAMYWLLKTDIIGEEMAQPMSALFGLVALVNSWLHLAVTGDALQTTNIMLVIVVSSALFVSWVWFGLLLGVGLIGWAVVALTQPFTTEWLHFSFAMVLSVVMALVIQRLRIKTYVHLYQLQQQNEYQRLQLVEGSEMLEQRVLQRTGELGQVNAILTSEIERREQVEIELKKSENALKKDRSDLEMEVAKRTVDLRNANIELKQAAQLKDEFLANMSHELRTPLNAILGNSEILTEELYGPLNDRQDAAVKRIDDSGRHLLSLINDVLDVSKIGAGKFEISLAPVNVTALCRASMMLVRTEAARKQIELSLVVDPGVRMLVADGQRIKQVLVNLLSNAVKFTPEGGRVGLIVRGRVRDSKVHLMVWDTGIGIDAEGIAKLFKPFVQLDSSLSKEHAGTGLGLALSQKLVGLHDGHIGVKSQLGKGALFVVTLPWSLETRAGGAHPISAETPDFLHRNGDAENSIADDERFAPPIDGEPQDIARWVTQSRDSQSPFEPLEIED